ncbi:hypothetical protein AC244_33170 [Ensifer adhaerens]|uniref:Uncharacterized protein n=1 Tax=Ensifer adhaerens TaxID=106592 RepID=A0A0L8BDU3_ENSAD|nr:hypothetical protein [Ensifer adhaerens]KOF12861.1 hypothetical protein AC244_33170 [Ensifer adhaerens]
MKGYSATSSKDYAFITNGFSWPLTLCFIGDGGVASGTDVRLLKFGNSTLAGHGGNEWGNEVFVVYQIDRQHKKVLFTLSRIGTKTISPNVVVAFVGDAVRALQ